MISFIFPAGNNIYVWFTIKLFVNFLKIMVCLGGIGSPVKASEQAEGEEIGRAHV